MRFLLRTSILMSSLWWIFSSNDQLVFVRLILLTTLISLYLAASINHKVQYSLERHGFVKSKEEKEAKMKAKAIKAWSKTWREK